METTKVLQDDSKLVTFIEHPLDMFMCTLFVEDVAKQGIVEEVHTEFLTHIHNTVLKLKENK